MKLYIVHTAAPGIFGRGIRFLTMGEVSHSLVLFRQPDFRRAPWMILEAGNNGFVGVPVDVAKMATWRLAYRMTEPHEICRDFLDGMCSRLGTPYDWKSIRSWLVAGVRNRMAKNPDKFRPKNPVPSRLYCSEAIAEESVFQRNCSLVRKDARVAFAEFTDGRQNPRQLADLQGRSVSFESADLEALRSEIRTDFTLQPFHAAQMPAQ